MGTISQRSIFITGGGSGIGRAVAIHFAQRGWFVGLADVNEAGLEETLNLIAGEAKFAHRLDVRDRAAWNEALEAFAKTAGQIDVVFNNAGVAHGGPFAQQPQSEIDSLVDVNVRGVIYGAQAAYPYLKASAPGSVLINTASVAGIVGVGGLSVYCASKWAVRGLSHSLDAEWYADGIKVTSLCPGFIDTPMIEQAQPNSNLTAKETLREAGVEISPVSNVPLVVWDAVHGDKIDYTVGKMARQMQFLKRWLPGQLRKRARSQGLGVDL